MKMRSSLALALATLFAAVLLPLVHAHAQYTVTGDGYIAMDGATDWDGLDNQGLETIVGWYYYPAVGQSRADTVYQALGQDDIGLCGAQARDTYWADSGAAWCSEYARWVYIKTGVPAENCYVWETEDNGNVDYACPELRDVTTVSDLVAWFGLLAGGWTDAGGVRPGQVRPGDYIALTTDGESFNHSALVVAISDDYRYIWTSEGNFDDCVRFNRRDFFVDGHLNPDINGVGNYDTLFDAITQP
jgi:hypothetical protein